MRLLVPSTSANLQSSARALFPALSQTPRAHLSAPARASRGVHVHRQSLPAGFPNPLQLPQNAGGGATGATLTALLTNFSETSLKPRHPSRRVFLGEPSASSDSKHGQHASRLRLKPSRANNLVVESSPLGA